MAMKTATSFEHGHIPGNAVLTAQNAVDIRQRYLAGAELSDLARAYGVSYQHVWNIVNRNKWKNAEQQVTHDRPNQS